MSAKAVFEGLVVDEAGRQLVVAMVGSEAQYVIDDDGFKRHVDAESVDREALRLVREQVESNRALVQEAMMRMLGNDDLFTKAAIDLSIKNMDDQVMERGIPDDARNWLGLMGFRIVVNLHGEVVKLVSPETTEEE